MTENNNNVESISDDDQEEENDVVQVSKKIRLAHSSVHNEFTQINARQNNGKSILKSKCNHCSTCYMGKNPTTLMKHLKLKHPRIAEQVMKTNNLRRLEKEELLQLPTSSTGLQTASSALFGSKSGTDQMSLDYYVNRSSSLPTRPKDKERLSQRKLALWIGGSTLPVNCVEDPNFENFLKSYDPQVTFLFIFNEL